ncbi:50S ribosomal protein L22 [Thiomicrospira aerophila AL3]|uniref:50S ribosomal protein L22 n=1 Tax=Thiomicrospira aerophila AL3 TaxID=717772 RepID=W0DTP8_9GAMM|nr:ImmA/IrrE family metallo-endopeptidase [Thiomicrospira aerophila]AHF01980.1 50S ribosomal protein L22 [Thiomicrospira aerophila AL3]
MAILRRKSIRKIHEAPTKFNVENLLKTAREHGIDTNPIDIKKLASSLGVQIKSIEMENEVSGYLRKEDGHWIIGVNALHHPNRKRFTIAHELGHYCLHSKVMDCFEDTVLFRKGETNLYETQANKFAAELLMPKDLFLDYIRNKSSEIESIAEHFEVSSMAVRLRAKNLGLGGHGVD